MNELPINKKIHLTLASAVVSATGISEITQALHSSEAQGFKLPDDWNYATMVGGKGEYVGTLPKRIAKYFYQKHKIKLSSDLLGKIGSIAHSNSAKNEEYIFDFDRKLNWSAGDFGDSGSCFWGCHTSGRMALQNNGCYAMRFFDNDEGFARCWIVPRRDFFILFNGYGLELSQQCHILATYLGLSYRRIALSNYGQQTGDLWINSGMGYLVGDEATINGKSEYDLKIETDDQQLCSCCEGHYNEDDLTFVGNCYYCRDCLEDLFTYCDECDEYKPNDEFTEVGHHYVCETCLDRYYYKCDNCDSYSKKATTTVKNGESVCSVCLENYFYCDECNDWADNDDKSPIDDICQNCYDYNYAACSDCGEHIHNDDRIDIGDKYFCKDCADNHFYCDECNNMVKGEKFHNGDKIVCTDCFKPLLEGISC